MKHTATIEQVRKGRVTDVDFEPTEEILRARGIDRRVRAEFVAKGLPSDWPWAVFAGGEEMVAGRIRSTVLRQLEKSDPEV